MKEPSKYLLELIYDKSITDLCNYFIIWVVVFFNVILNFTDYHKKLRLNVLLMVVCFAPKLIRSIPLIR